MSPLGDSRVSHAGTLGALLGRMTTTNIDLTTPLYGAFGARDARGTSPTILSIAPVTHDPLPRNVRLMAYHHSEEWVAGWARGWMDRATNGLERAARPDTEWGQGYSRGWQSRIDAEDTSAMFGGPIV